MTTINVPETFTAQVRGQDFVIDGLADMPQVSLDKIFAYGMQRIFNDSAAGAKNGAEALELAKKRLDALRSGIMRQSATRIGDPVKAEAMRLARPKVEAAFRAKGMKPQDFKTEVTAKVAELAARADFVALATANVEASKGLDLGDIEI